MLVAFELEDGIDDVFEHLRTSQRAFLGDVADEDDGRARFLGKLEDTGGTFAHLTNAASTRLEVIGGDGLDGVDDEDVGLDIGDVGEDGVEIGFAGDVDGVEGRGSHRWLRLGRRGGGRGRSSQRRLRRRRRGGGRGRGR